MNKDRFVNIGGLKSMRKKLLIKIKIFMWMEEEENVG